MAFFHCCLGWKTTFLNESTYQDTGYTRVQTPCFKLHVLKQYLRICLQRQWAENTKFLQRLNVMVEIRERERVRERERGSLIMSCFTIYSNKTV